jgi:hypothetical protein
MFCGNLAVTLRLKLSFLENHNMFSILVISLTIILEREGGGRGAWGKLLTTIHLEILKWHGHMGII